MADIPLTVRNQGPLSFSATSATTAATDIITNAALVGACQPGPLRDVLDQNYADLPAALNALASAGAIIAPAAEATVGVSVGFAANRIRLAVADSASPSPLAIRVSLAHTTPR